MNSTFEYNNNLTSLPNEYGSLHGNYNYNKLIANKLPPTVPSQHYPVLLEQSNLYGYDALTHDGDGSNYYNVKNAYGTNCSPSYFVAKCPQNKFIRPFLASPKDNIVSPSACPVEGEYISEGFATEPPKDLLLLIKTLHMVLFYDKHCKHSKQIIQEMIDTIGAENVRKFVQLKDIAYKANEQELTNLGGFAVPFIYSQTTSNSVTGYFPLPKIIHDLQNGNVNLEKIKELQLKIYIMKGCHFCHKLKEELLKHAEKFIEYKDALHPSNKHEIANVRGFPHIVSKKTGKSITGLPRTIEQLIHDLS
jgi:hypothetical protein